VLLTNWFRGLLAVGKAAADIIAKDASARLYVFMDGDEEGMNDNT